MQNNKSIINIITIFLVLFIIIVSSINAAKEEYQNVKNTIVDEAGNVFSNDSTFKIISSDENYDLEPIIKEYASNNNIDIEIDYAGTLEIMDRLNSGEEYDAVWASNSIWLYMLDKNVVSTSESKSISINPVVFAVKKSKAEELGLVGKEIYTRDIVEKIKDGSLNFAMSNPTQTNSGATAYLGLLSALAGNPEVLNENILNDQLIKDELITFFSGMERSSGDESFLEQVFLNGSYDAVVTYESSIININKDSSMKSDPLYALYPVDGVSISDSPLAYIATNGDDAKKEKFLSLRNYLLSDEGQNKLAQSGRRTWYGGINTKADKSVFNPNWGIDTTKYIVPIKFPSAEVIQKSLALYQNELRKPIHTVFCLDYSGSMYGTGIRELQDAMNYILSERAEEDLIQYTEKDKISVIPFSTDVIDVWSGYRGEREDEAELISKINNLKPTGATNIYDSTIEALKILENENEKYNVSVILMTDGNSNNGTYNDLRNYYSKKSLEIPVYSIMFGSAYEGQLQNIADLTNGKVFDGKIDLLKAFKEVRGYN